MKRPRILFVSHDASRTGAPLLLLNLLRWLRGNTSWDVEVLLADGGELRPDFAQLAPTRTLRPWRADLRIDAIRDRLARRRVVSELRSQPWSLVYSNTATNGEVVDLLGRRQPVVSHIHELATTIESYGSDNLDAIRRQTTRFIACAEAVKSDLASKCRINPAAIDVVHGFIPEVPPVHDADRRLGIRRSVREELRIPQDAFVVGGSGLVTWRKAPDVFLAVAAAIKRQRPSAEVHFLWVGATTGPITPRDLEHDVTRLGLAGRVHFIGSRPNPLRYFHAFDVFAMVSREDPFPLVCLEVASVGTPIVCFELAGGTKEFVEQDCGFVLPYLDAAAMAHAILTLQDSGDLREAFGRRAADKVRQRHDIAYAAPKIVDIVERLL